MRIAVTGTNGFVGSALVPLLQAAGEEVVAVRRDQPVDLAGASALIHLAGLAHVKADPAAMRAANRDHALDVARAARLAGVQRLVFVSSINVVAGHRGATLSPNLPPRPASAYGQAKAEAETALLALDGIDIAVLRPPLVFGPGAPGNLRALMRLCAGGLPLPFASVHNRRSMIGVTNLCRALHFLASTERAAVAGRIFHIAEDQPFSLRTIVSDCRSAMGLPPRLFSVSPALLRLALVAAGRSHMAEQLLGDLVVDDRSLRSAGWTPQAAAAAADLAAMARDCR